MVRNAAITRKETTMNTRSFNFRAVASAIGALAVTLFLSWTFVDATRVAHVSRDVGHGFALASWPL